MMNTLLAVVAIYKNLRSRGLVINAANYHQIMSIKPEIWGNWTCGT